VIVCVPTARFALLKEEAPPLRATTASWDWPSRNVIEPVGTPVPDCGATVAVNVIAWPEVAYVDEADTVVVVAVGEDSCGVKTKTVAEYAGKL